MMSPYLSSKFQDAGGRDSLARKMRVKGGVRKEFDALKRENAELKALILNK